MINRDYILKTLSNELPKLKREYNVSRIGLFGSYSQNCATESSDIDLIIEFSESPGFKFVELCDYLEKLFNKNVDVLTPAGLNSIRVSSIIDNILKSILYVEAA